MKRIIICAVLLVLAVWVSVFSSVRVNSVSEELDLRVDSILAALKNGEKKQITEQTASLTEYWEGQEKVLGRVIRHSYTDAITVSMARIQSLAEFEDYGELSAELAGIKRNMRHIRSSEEIKLNSLLS